MAGRAVPMQVGGMTLLVETSPVTGTEQTSSGKLDRALETVAEAFERAQSAIVAVATSTVHTIGDLADRSVHPDEMEVRFGLKFSAQGNVIVAGAAGEATLEVRLIYRRDLAGNAAPAAIGQSGAAGSESEPGRTTGDAGGSPAGEPSGASGTPDDGD